MSPIEITAVLLGLANIVLIIRRSVWNFPFAIAMVTLYGMIFFEAKLYSDAGLQIFFMLVNLYGWWSWRHAKQDQGAIMVRRLGRLAYATCIVATVLAIAGWGYFMGASTDASYPYWDATIAMMSVAGQVLMTKRYVENWHWWIIVNLVSIPLYFAKGLFLTTGLYGLFLVLAIVGLVNWLKAERS